MSFIFNNTRCKICQTPQSRMIPIFNRIKDKAYISLEKRNVPPAGDFLWFAAKKVTKETAPKELSAPSLPFKRLKKRK